MIEAGVLLGLPRSTSTELVVQTLFGAATMLRETGEHPTVLREQVSSPGGTTMSALRQLDDHKVRAAFITAMESARDRSREPGRLVTVAIQRLVPDDWQQARRLRLESLRQDGLAFGTSYEAALAHEEQQWRERLATATTFHALVDGEPLGTITVRQFAENAVGEAEITGMWVDPAGRGRGLGDLLVDTALAAWRAMGGSRMSLWCVTTNEPALRLYSRNGFQPTGRTEQEPDEPRGARDGPPLP
ncbi:hypothetical protein GCM10025868_30470 [Angustibacter aerolatus]|uniref:N-acetyltransferase domain-containing protein n=1 Tax=Angustibacter aerolatus TaxID=1162965 RepID=A0ABQ6JLR7_9ACTN|nr:hypothetical protein GCM10025868_30470 [Angustibacter aerolatus]